MAGKAWTGLMSIIFVPLYLRFLGIEAYGIIGLFASLMALISILDLGLSTTLNRELARLSSIAGPNDEARNLVRTLEIIYWIMGFLLGACVLALGPLIARNWVNVQGLPIKSVENAFIFMGFVIAFQWPTSLYLGGLIGLQKQVLLNGVQSVVSTFQSFGAVLALWLISPTIEMYFAWQIVICLLQTIILAICLWKYMPLSEHKAVFKFGIFKNIWKFAAGITGISILTAILTQLDKIVLSKLLSLEMFGYYILAFNVASFLSYFALPVFFALFPKISQQVALNNKEEISALYHKGCKLVAILVLPIAVLLSLFSKEILFVWLGNQSTVNNTSFLLSLIVIGTAFNSLMILPYALQLAYGWTKLSFYKNVIAVIIFIPLLVGLVTKYGATGGAVAWIILNVGYVLFEIPIMHHHLHKGEMWHWYIFDIGLPLFVILSIGIISRITMPQDVSILFSSLWIFFTGLFATLLSLGLIYKTNKPIIIQLQ
jgi:O-antigen/teichoic acid export membrane protein